MANSITITLNVPAQTTLYVMADVFASSEQRVRVTAEPPLHFPELSAQGSGIATGIGHQGLWVNDPTSCRFTLAFDYESGSSWYPSPNVVQTALTAGSPTYNEVTVISQNGDDNADCCTVRFVWFS